MFAKNKARFLGPRMGILRHPNYFLLRKEDLSFPPRIKVRDKLQWESSFFALDSCFRRGDIVGFCFPLSPQKARISFRRKDSCRKFAHYQVRL
jgi:hypothetical protein